MYSMIINTYVVVIFLSQGIFIFLLFQLHKNKRKTKSTQDKKLTAT